MRIIIFIVCNIFVLQAAIAYDNYLPLVEEGKTWKMQYHHLDGLYPDYDYRYYIEGDTLITGRSCKKLYAFNEGNEGRIEYKMALCEADGKVFFIPKGLTKAYLLYDFTISTGQTAMINSPMHPEQEVDMRKSEDRLVETCDTYRHCLHVSVVVEPELQADFLSGWWIEGVGSELGLLNTWGFGAAGNNNFFVCCEKDGKTIFSVSDFQEKLEELDDTDASEYYPEGTTWIEIRLDTLKYIDWYSKVGNEWCPNFETIEYYVRGEYIDESKDERYSCVYSNGPEWTDSLAFLVSEKRDKGRVRTSRLINDDGCCRALSSAETYQFDWEVGQTLSFQTLAGANSTCSPPCGWYNLGMIEEIKEGDFGGVRPLKYVDLNGKAPVLPEAPWYLDTNGGRIIQGIGVTEWDDGECLFGPVSIYRYSPRQNLPEHHYRSMLVHFERNDEVLYDVWPEKGGSGIPSVDGRQPSAGNVVYDLQGRRLQGEPERGLYIENGRKKAK